MTSPLKFKMLQKFLIWRSCLEYEDVSEATHLFFIPVVDLVMGNLPPCCRSLKCFRKFSQVKQLID